MLTSILMAFIGAIGIFLVVLALAWKRVPNSFERSRDAAARRMTAIDELIAIADTNPTRVAEIKKEFDKLKQAMNS